MSTKCVWVKAPFKEEGVWRTKKVQVGTTFEKVEKGIFNKKTVFEEVPVYEEQRVWETHEVSDCEIDGEKFNEHISQEIENLESEGYEVVSISPVTSGRYKYDAEVKTYGMTEPEHVGLGWGYGFSYTEGVTIIAKASDGA